MTVPARITLVTLGVADVDRATRFYESLGWRRSSASVEGDVTFIQLSGLALALWGRQDLAADAGMSSEGHGFRGTALAMNLESEAEVDRVAAEWVAAGGSMVVQPHRMTWGGYSGYVADPDGHLWELAWNPGFTLLPDGTVRLPT
jgi:uncharacterized protein